MFSALINWIKSLFRKESVGILTEKLIENAQADLSREIFNVDNQQKAYEFVKELEEMEISNYEKAKLFNKKLTQWALKCGKVLLESVINCLREMAVNVLKQELMLTAKKNG